MYNNINVPFAGIIKQQSSQLYDLLSKQVDTIVSMKIRNVLENYITSLTNKLLTNLRIQSYCVKGVCYYEKCKGYDCKVKYCQYNLLRSEEKCAIHEIWNLHRKKIQRNTNKGKNIGISENNETT